MIEAEDSYGNHQPPRKDGADCIGIRVVDFLDACAGSRARASQSHDTVAHGGTVETIAFNVRDTKRQSIHSLAVLAEFGVAPAKDILAEHFIGEAGVQLDRMDRDTI